MYYYVGITVEEDKSSRQFNETGYWKLNVSYCENEKKNTKETLENIIRTQDDSLGAKDRW